MKMSTKTLMMRLKDPRITSELANTIRKFQGGKVDKFYHPSSFVKFHHTSNGFLLQRRHCMCGKRNTEKGIMLRSTRTYCDTKESRPINPVASGQLRVLYIDTLQLSKKFQEKGFSADQAECLTEAFVDVINASMDSNSKTMVTKPQQEIMIQQLLAQIQSVKKDMIILEKSEFTSLRNETEKQSLEIKQLQSSLHNEVSKLKSNISLDINLERSRATEAHSVNEKQLHALHAENEKQIQALHNKIETDVANLKTVYEKYRNEVIKYSAGAVLSCATVCLGIIRLWS